MNGRTPFRPQGLRVAIDAQLDPETWGGVAMFTMSLIHALGKLQDGDERYSIVVGNQKQMDWLCGYVGPNQELVFCDNQSATPTGGGPGRAKISKLLRLAGRPLMRLARRVKAELGTARRWPEVPLSPGFYEQLDCEVLHIPHQNFVLCSLPTVYNPHDLQHLHYPQFWPPSTIAWRETIYPAGCHFANTIVVGSQWIKDDVVRHYRVSPDRIQVIPEGPPAGFYSEPTDAILAEVVGKYVLDRPFAVYPAVPWPHKNHLRLLEALAFLRDKRGLVLPLVCTGARLEPHWSKLQSRIKTLGLSNQVKFLGFVPDADLRAILRLSQFLVMPSLFEACSLPVFEAWHDKVPVACSNATALPEQMRDAGLLFDAKDVESIADAMWKLATDDALRRELIERGIRRARDFDWERTAKAYRAVYRRAADARLTDEDRWILSQDWMRNPQTKQKDRDHG